MYLLELFRAFSLNIINFSLRLLKWAFLCLHNAKSFASIGRNWNEWFYLLLHFSNQRFYFRSDHFNINPYAFINKLKSAFQIFCLQQNSCCITDNVCCLLIVFISRIISNITASIWLALLMKITSYLCSIYFWINYRSRLLNLRSFFLYWVFTSIKSCWRGL